MNGKQIVVYTAPLKALSAEKFHEWSHGVFSQQSIVMLTGDTLTSPKVRAAKMKECATADIVLMTSELLDSLTRNHTSEHYAWLFRVAMLIVDECHIIASAGRGDCVETAIMRFTQINPAAKVWLLSATAPNVDQFATWLTRLNGKPTHAMNSSWRPTTLVWHYIQHETIGSYADIQQDKMARALAVVLAKPTEKFLIFVWDKTTGRLLSGLLQRHDVANQFYNADLEYEERSGILQQFEEADGLPVIISTSALAWGCNTSAQNVIIVGNHRGLAPIDELDIIQSAGRAGRFGKAPEGHVYFICDSVTAWKKVIARPRPVESTLLDEDVLSFHCCAEIRNKVIMDVETLHAWYSRTLSVIQKALSAGMVEGVVAKLVGWECVKMDGNGLLSCLPLGVVAATLYYHPKDVYHWAQCLKVLDRHDLWDDRHALAYLLAAPTARLPYIPKREEDRVREAVFELKKSWPGRVVIPSTLFADLADLLGGADKPSPAARQIRSDIERIAGALTWISGIQRVARLDAVKVIMLRVKYGVPAYLATLCQLQHVGATRAKKLYEAGLDSIIAVRNSPSVVRSVLGERVGGDVVAAAAEFKESVL